MNGKPLLEVKDLSIQFLMSRENIEICSNVSFSIGLHEKVGLIGESGCGKTLIALSILRLLPDNALISGDIHFDNQNLVTVPSEEIEKVRGKRISMIFEQPKSCLNPVYPIGWQIKEAVERSNNYPAGDLHQKAWDLLQSVGMDPERYNEYPHQMSGGMHQRVMIAMAMASNPKLLIADEPTTALDLINQAQILDLIKQKVIENHCSLFLITHDLDVVVELCDRIMVMYAGEIVEVLNVFDLTNKPLHPYTFALYNSMDGNELKPILGDVPEFGKLPSGCRFHPRCYKAVKRCSDVHPELRQTENGYVRCHLA